MHYCHVALTQQSMSENDLGMTKAIQRDIGSVSLLTIPQVSERIGCGRTTVFELIKNGELQAVRFGPRTTRVPSDAVDDYITRVRRTARLRPAPATKSRDDLSHPG